LPLVYLSIYTARCFFKKELMARLDNKNKDTSAITITLNIKATTSIEKIALSALGGSRTFLPV
jgi:hypothetical protein